MGEARGPGWACPHHPLEDEQDRKGEGERHIFYLLGPVCD